MRAFTESGLPHPVNEQAPSRFRWQMSANVTLLLACPGGHEGLTCSSAQRSNELGFLYRVLHQNRLE